MNDPIVIVSAARTAMGSFQGGFAGLTAANLGAVAIKAAVERAGCDANLIEEVLMGCVLQAGQGQAPARQAALQAGLPLSAGCATIHKVCGSAMKATMLGHDGILAGSYGAAVVGGMESMTNAPYLLSKARGGYRLGHGQMFDHMFMDGLEDAYSKETRGRLMGTYADDRATPGRRVAGLNILPFMTKLQVRQATTTQQPVEGFSATRQSGTSLGAGARRRIFVRHRNRARRHHGGNGVLVHHLGNGVLQQHHVLVERFDLTLQLDAVDQVDRYRNMFFPQNVQKRVL